MLYIERKPAAPLRGIVRCFWYATASRVDHRHERILPSGCAHLVFGLSRDFLTDCAEMGLERRTAPALVVGQRSVYETIATADLADLAGVLFAPGALLRLTDDRADLLSNTNFPLDRIWRGSAADALRSRMLEASSPEARLRILEDYLVRKLLDERTGRHATPHPAVAFALEQFAKADGPSVAEVARGAGWSSRRFSQIFREQIGFRPNVWRRLQRFQRAVQHVRAGGEVRWADLAIECGFYDQSHFANEFRSFSGVDLTTYMAVRRPLWVNYVNAEQLKDE